MPPSDTYIQLTQQEHAKARVLLQWLSLFLLGEGWKGAGAESLWLISVVRRAHNQRVAPHLMHRTLHLLLIISAQGTQFVFFWAVPRAFAFCQRPPQMRCKTLAEQLLKMRVFSPHREGIRYPLRTQRPANLYVRYRFWSYALPLLQVKLHFPMLNVTQRWKWTPLFIIILILNTIANFRSKENTAKSIKDNDWKVKKLKKLNVHLFPLILKPLNIVTI